MSVFDTIPQSLAWFIVILTGLILGSFTTAISHRVPLGLSWVSGRSHCPSCKTPLTVLDLLPVFTWLLQRGRCRHCGVKISYRYPLIELIVLLFVALGFLTFGFSGEWLFLCLAAPFLMALAVIDFDHKILPNQLVFIVGLFGFLRLGAKLYFGGVPYMPVLYEFIGGAFIFALTALALGWLVGKMLGKDALGFGDVKFFFVSGLWLGLVSLPYYLILSGLFGVLIALIWQKIKKENLFPFGPALIASFALLLLL